MIIDILTRQDRLPVYLIIIKPTLDVCPFIKAISLASVATVIRLIQYRKKYNKYRKPSENMLPKLHAEINCINSIRHLNINFSKVKLYIYRIRKDQPFGLSRPCPSCMAAIKDLGIKDIYYTTNDGYVHERIEKYGVGGVA